MPRARSVRIYYYNSWAGALETAAEYIHRLPGTDVRPMVANPADPALLQKAELDRDWYGEIVRCFDSLDHPNLQFLPTFVCGRDGLLEIVRSSTPGTERWLVTMAHQPQQLGPNAGRVFSLLARAGVRILYYAFDEASRFMPCFRDIAPHLDVLIHDEEPLDPAGAAALRRDCVRIRRSWVANFLPFSVPFNETPEEKILFLGSQPGLTPHRQRQIDFLREHFKDRFVVSADHSVSMASRPTLNRYKVGFCPEGRKFSTPAMSRSHTDRPFWSGCLGLVPVAENSAAGNRLDELAAAGLILRYPRGNLKALAEYCERALAAPAEERRRIYTHFNHQETIGRVVADAILAAAPRGATQTADSPMCPDLVPVGGAGDRS